MKSIFTQEYQIAIDQLKDARIKASLTQKYIADKLSKSQSFVSKYENRERRLDIVEFVSICRLIDIDPCRIIQRMKFQPPGMRSRK